MDLWKAKNFSIGPIIEHFKERVSSRYKNHFSPGQDLGSFVNVASKLWSMAPEKFRSTNLVNVAKTVAKVLLLICIVY
jgi:hypothetical protein